VRWVQKHVQDEISACRLAERKCDVCFVALGIADALLSLLYDRF
jgi:hypothetical protein